MRSHDLIFASAGLVAFFAGHALGGLSQVNTPLPGVLVQALAGPATNGSGSSAGLDLASTYISGSNPDIQEGTASGAAAFASRTASFSGANTTNSASAQVGMGWGKFQAINSAPNTSAFAQANAGGGWKDSFLIADPVKTGQQGFMVFTILVSGGLSASGFAGSSSFDVQSYKDNQALLTNALSSSGNSDLLGTEQQYGHWGVSSAPNVSKNVAGVVTFAVPFTYGTGFTLGVYGRAAAGMRSASGVPDNSQASSQFQNTMTWGGISQINVGGSAVGGYTITSGSGIDWTGPIVPAPGVAGLAVAGVLVGSRRRRV